MNISPFKRGDKVVGYCRYSEGTEQGLKNQSTEEQADAIRKFCNEQGLILTKIFADPFASGRSVAKRDNYLAMLSFLLHKKKPDVQGLIVWDWERYGRNFDQAQLDAARLRMAGYKLFSLQQPIADDGPFAHVLEAMYFASAQNQSDMISADVKRALQANFQKWKVVPRSCIPKGWIPVEVQMGTLSDGSPRIGYRFEPDPDLKDQIIQAVEARIAGRPISEIRHILGKSFSNNKLWTLFRKPLLYGSFTYGGMTIEDYCEPIINKEVWDKLQVVSDAIKKSPRKEGSGAHMETDIADFYPLILQRIKHFIRKMESCSRGGYRSADPCVEGLVSFSIYCLRFPVQIWGDGNSTANLKHFGERRSIVP